MTADIRAFDSWIPQYVEAAYVRAQAISSGSDTTLSTTRGIYITADGNITVYLVDAPNTPIVFTAAKAGTILPLAVIRVGSATTVDVVALF